MEFFTGIHYNIKGLMLGLRTPKLLWLGALRFVIILALALLFSGLLFVWQDALMSVLWDPPASGLMVYVWHLASWLLSAVLIIPVILISYGVAQVLFCVVIMDYMSRITERLVLGREISVVQSSWPLMFLYLIKQEIPRTLLPIAVMAVVAGAGLLTPLGPVILMVSAGVTGAFLAWDNTDLLPARHMQSFRERMRFLTGHPGFHLGFGLLFLIPWVNIVFLSFAPVGATLFHIQLRQKRGQI